MMREGLDATCEALDPKHPDTLTSMTNFAVVLLQKQGKLGDAVALLRESFTGRCSVLGPTHPDTCATFSWLVEFLTKQGKTREARELQAKFGGSARRK
jgi:hypothetical protein